MSQGSASKSLLLGIAEGGVGDRMVGAGHVSSELDRPVGGHPESK